MDLIDRIKIYFYDRAPNTILLDYVLLEFKTESRSDIEAALSELEEEFLESVVTHNQRYPALVRKTYRIQPDVLGDYPVDTVLNVAGIQIPRLIDGDIARSEDINNMIYSVNKVIDARVIQFEKQLEAQNRKFWATLISILGLFIGLFSLINIGVKTLTIPANVNLSPIDVAFQSLINLAPLALVLLLFLWLLNKIMNKHVT